MIKHLNCLFVAINENERALIIGSKLKLSYAMMSRYKWVAQEAMHNWIYIRPYLYKWFFNLKIGETGLNVKYALCWVSNVLELKSLKLSSLRLKISLDYQRSRILTYWQTNIPNKDYLASFFKPGNFCSTLYHCHGLCPPCLQRYYYREFLFAPCK